MSKTFAHGTTYGYSRGGCRCDACKAAKAAAAKKDRKRKPRDRSAWREANKEHVAAYQKRWRAENREKIAADQRAYYRANKAKLAGRQKAYREANPDRAAESRRKWRDANRDQVKAYRHLRRAAEVGNGVFVILPGEWNRVLQRYRHECAYCGGSGPLEMEHVVPVAKGGRHSIGNLVPACRSCNASKHANLLVEWLHKQRG